MRITIASLKAELAGLQAELAAVKQERDALLVAQRPSRGVTQPAAAQRPVSKERAAMNAARELAMRTGACVKAVFNSTQGE